MKGVGNVWARHVHACSMNSWSAVLQEQDLSIEGVGSSGQQGTGMTLIAVLLCTLVRGAKLQEAKASSLLQFVSQWQQSL